MNDIEIIIIFLLCFLIIGYMLGRQSSIYREMEDNYKLFKYDDLKEENETLKKTIEILKGSDK